MIRKIIKYGVSFGAGYALGKEVGKQVAESDGYNGDVWKGQTHELSIPYNKARDLLTVIDECLKENTYPDEPFAEDDLKSMRTQLAHGLAEADERLLENVTVKASDREKLRLYESVMSVHVERLKKL